MFDIGSDTTLRYACSVTLENTNYIFGGGREAETQVKTATYFRPPLNYYSRDFIIFSFDNRGTGGRGKAFKDLAYGDYGKYLVADHIAAAKYLQGLTYVDGENIGVWGWSIGVYGDGVFR